MNCIMIARPQRIRAKMGMALGGVVRMLVAQDSQLGVPRQVCIVNFKKILSSLSQTKESLLT